VQSRQLAEYGQEVEGSAGWHQTYRSRAQPISHASALFEDGRLCRFLVCVDYVLVLVLVVIHEAELSTGLALRGSADNLRFVSWFSGEGRQMEW